MIAKGRSRKIARATITTAIRTDKLFIVLTSLSQISIYYIIKFASCKQFYSSSLESRAFLALRFLQLMRMITRTITGTMLMSSR